jgi:hypothetical protein
LEPLILALPPIASATCHSNCASRPCWSSEPDGCQRCQRGQYLEAGICVSECSLGGFVYDDWLCETCHPTCQGCNGPTARECTACTNSTYLFEQECRAQCPTGTFADNTTNICEPCTAAVSTCLFFTTPSLKCLLCSVHHVLQTPTQAALHAKATTTFSLWWSQPVLPHVQEGTIATQWTTPVKAVLLAARPVSAPTSAREFSPPCQRVTLLTGWAVAAKLADFLMSLTPCYASYGRRV